MCSPARHRQFNCYLQTTNTRPTRQAKYVQRCSAKAIRVCVCSLRYPACNAHVPYCQMWPALLYNAFPHCLINGTIFEKKKIVTEYKTCVLVSSINLPETYPILTRTERDIIVNYITHHVECPLFLSDCNKTWKFSRNFRKILSQISRERVQWEPSCSMRTDGQTRSRRFSQFCERA